MQLDSSASILLVGCGRMGSAMLNGWRDAGYNNITIIDPAHPAHTSPAAIAGQFFDIIVLAVKPQVAADALPAIAPFLKHSSIVLSIMAGISVSTISTLLKFNGAIIRSMPNTPAMIGKGITVAVPNAATSPIAQETMRALLSPLGSVLILDNELLMDAVTAVSGSGPAYLFYLTEILTNAGITQGLPATIATQLARETVIGAAHLMEQQAHIPVETLREQVTSKGGTTEAALNILKENSALQNLFNRAIEAATNRFRT